MSDAGAAQRAHTCLQAILKAVVVGQDVSDPTNQKAGESTTLFSSAGVLEPLDVPTVHRPSRWGRVT